MVLSTPACCNWLSSSRGEYCRLHRGTPSSGLGGGEVRGLTSQAVPTSAVGNAAAEAAKEQRAKAPPPQQSWEKMVQPLQRLLGRCRKQRRTMLGPS
jgi:hypothetical protein